MPDRSHALSPEALSLIDTIARTGSFAAAARELGRVPSALTYSVRQLEEQLDVLLFDRRSRQARFTPAGEALLHEGRRLLADMGAVAQRVQRVASGWEPRLSVAADTVVSRPVLLELCQAFYAETVPREGQAAAAAGASNCGTQLRLRSEVLSGTWEALISGQADLAIGVGTELPAPGGVVCETLGLVDFCFVAAPHHALANATQPLDDAALVRHRAVAVADSAQRHAPVTVNILDGQETFTVATMGEKLQALRLGLGVGYVPRAMAAADLRAGRLVECRLQRPPYAVEVGYAWRATSREKRSGLGLGLQWWLRQLGSAATRKALLQKYGTEG